MDIIGREEDVIIIINNKEQERHLVDRSMYIHDRTGLPTSTSGMYSPLIPSYQILHAPSSRNVVYTKFHRSN